MRPDPIGQAMAVRVDLEIDRLHRPERPHDLRERFVVAHAACGIEVRLRDPVRMI